MGRILSAGLLGGLLVFGWGFVSHVLLPIGSMGFSSLSDESAVSAALESGISEPGLYFIPGPPEDDSEEAMEAWNAKFEAGPRALVTFDPEGGEAMSPTTLAMQFAASVLAAILAALVVSHIAGYGTRVLCVMLMGVFAWVSVSVSHSIWYLFPTEFALGELIGQAIGWLLGGMGIAGITGRRAT